MTKFYRRGNTSEDNMIRRIDRGFASSNRPGDIFAEHVKKRLHECTPGDWVKQVLPGKENYGPLLRILDPSSGILEDKHGKRIILPPKTQVLVEI